MSDIPNDPPMVLRPPQGPVRPLPLNRLRPGFWEAVLWCLLLLATQLLGVVVAVSVALTVYALAAPDPAQFLNDQLEGLLRALDAKTPAADRPPVPGEIGQSLAWGMVGAQVLSAGLILLVLRRRVGRDWKRQIGVRRPSGVHVLLILLVVPGFMLSADAIHAGLARLTGAQPAETDALREVFRHFPWVLTALAVAIGPGLVEEFWCRGFLGRGLCARYGLAAGMLLTSMFFGALHILPLHALIAGLMGLYLHFVYLATRSIWTAVLLHALNNGIAIYLTLAAPVQADANQSGPGVAAYLAAAGLLVFASIALWTCRAVEEPAPGEAEPGWKPEYPGISAPPDGSGVRLVNGRVSPTALVFALLAFGALGFLLVR